MGLKNQFEQEPILVFLFCLLHDCFSFSTCQGYKVSLKSMHGPIDVFLCPDDSSGVCSPVTGSSPTKPNNDPSLFPSLTQTTDQTQAATPPTVLEVGLRSPVCLSSTVAAASQHEPTSLVLGGDTGERVPQSSNSPLFFFLLEATTKT